MRIDRKKLEETAQTILDWHLNELDEYKASIIEKVKEMKEHPIKSNWLNYNKAIDDVLAVLDKEQSE